jgi:hypothetical protein
MKPAHAILFVLGFAALIGTFSQHCQAQERQENRRDIWAEDESRRPRWGHRGPELSEEMIEHIMKDLKEKDPAKARELIRLREQDPEKFEAELREHGREEFGRVIRERMEARRQRMEGEFIEWLEKNYPQDAQELARLKMEDPRLYISKFEYSLRKYGRIFEAAKENPELAEVLKEDLELKKKRDELLRKIDQASSEQEKQALITQLEEVVSNRYDLIVRRKQIAYKQLLAKLEELKQQIKESNDEITKWTDEEFKAGNVKERVRYLIGEVLRFRWD